jgi:polysaccharide export outer membrane protein
MHTVTTGRESISMLSASVFNHCSILPGVTASIVTAMLLVSPTPRAMGQQATTATGVPAIAARSLNGPGAPASLTEVPEDFAGLKLAPGFLLNVQVFDEPDLSGHVRVDSDGNVSLPFLKQIHVAGGTVAQTKEMIEDGLRSGRILKNPQVTVNVEQFATSSATVMGEVVNPGKVELLVPHSLLDVLGMTGGETAMASDEIELKRADASAGTQSTTYHYARGGDAAAIRDVMVHPGDTVIVKRMGVVYVVGGVNRPGGYVMQENGELNVAQAISMAQGLALQAKVNGLRVVQHNADGKPVEIPISYNKIMDGKEKPMQLAAGDIVYVPISKTKTVLGATTGLIGQTAAASIYAAKPF